MFRSLCEFVGDWFGPQYSSGAALPQKNTSVQNNHFRFHTTWDKYTNLQKKKKKEKDYCLDNDLRCRSRKMKIISSDWVALLCRLCIYMMRCPLFLLGSFLNFFGSHLLLLYEMFLCVYSPASKRAIGLTSRPGLKGTNGPQKTYEIYHVYSIFYSGFMCQTTVIFGITKDGSLY